MSSRDIWRERLNLFVLYCFNFNVKGIGALGRDSLQLFLL